MTIDHTLQQGIAHHNAGRLQQAELIYRQILETSPNQPDALHLMGVLAGQAGRHDLATDLFRKAIAASPRNPDYYRNLGFSLQNQCLFAEAVESFQQVVLLVPNHPDAHFHLGNAQWNSNDFAGALASYRWVVALQPSHVDAHGNMGSALLKLGHLDEAVLSYRQAISLQPNFLQAHRNLATALIDLKRFDEAIESLQCVAELQPDNAGLFLELGLLLLDQGKYPQAVDCFERAIRLKPDFAQAYNNLGVALKEQRKITEAITAHEQALKFFPDYVEAHHNLGILWKGAGQLDRSLASFERALVIAPDNPNVLTGLGGALQDAGQIDRSIQTYRKALAIDPHLMATHDSLLFAMLFQSDRAASFAERQRYNRQFVRPLSHLIQPCVNNKKTDRRLRIGYVSPDFYNHPVGRFLLPLLANHDHAKFEVFCYAQVLVPDEITAGLRSHADAWRSTVGLSDDQMADVIRRDQIDILIDLAMHTGHHRLMVFARKPAPVQVTYLAYAGGTGVETIDYRLTDRYLDPDETDDKFYLEKSIRLTGTYWCYQPNPAAPAVGDLPALNNGVITLGCLNKFSKISTASLETWAHLLQQIPNSRLMLHAKAGSHRDSTIRFFRDQGISSNRLEMIPFLSQGDYFATFNRIDIALDPFPCSGGTTTCDALWMGVPVVTLAGQTALARATASILSNVGLAELISHSTDQYKKIVVDLADDLPRLKQLRSTLPTRMIHSSLMDSVGYTQSIETAYRDMWQKWCETKSA